MLSEAQRRKYFALAHRAWLVDSMRSNLDERDIHAQDAWRREQMAEACGVRSTLKLDPVDGYDAIMLRFAQIVDDTKLIEYYATAKERRMRNRIKIAMQQLADIERRTVTWDYVRSIHYQMNLPAEFEDCPAELLWKLYQAMDTHIRRLRRRSAEARSTHVA